MSMEAPRKARSRTRTTQMTGPRSSFLAFIGGGAAARSLLLGRSSLDGTRNAGGVGHMFAQGRTPARPLSSPTAHFPPRAHIPPRAHFLTRPQTDQRSAAVDVGRQRPDEGKVAVLLGEVEAVPDDELRRDVEPDVLDVDLDLGGLRLTQQGSDLDRCRAAAAEVGQQPGQGEAGVDDVL